MVRSSVQNYTTMRYIDTSSAEFTSHRFWRRAGPPGMLYCRRIIRFRLTFGVGLVAKCVARSTTSIKISSARIKFHFAVRAHALAIKMDGMNIRNIEGRRKCSIFVLNILLAEDRSWLTIQLL